MDPDDAVDLLSDLTPSRPATAVAGEPEDAETCGGCWSTTIRGRNDEPSSLSWPCGRDRGRFRPDPQLRTVPALAFAGSCGSAADADPDRRVLVSCIGNASLRELPATCPSIKDPNR